MNQLQILKFYEIKLYLYLLKNSSKYLYKKNLIFKEEKNKIDEIINRIESINKINIGEQ